MSLTKLPLIIDCDPGQDDAVNLFLAFASPEEVDVIGVTTVAGNSPVHLTQRNARLICELAGRADVPVYAGCAEPLLLPPISAEHVHGESGIDGIELFEPAAPCQAMHAVDFLIEAAMADRAGPLTIVATGALTNIAVALIKEPAIRTRIERIILMGGAMREAGNITPSAEFNMRVDPHAAQRVFASGIPIAVLSLDITHQVLVTSERLRRIREIGNPVARATHDMLTFSERYDVAKYGSDGAPLHDPCTMIYLLRPDLFRSRKCSVVVETASPLSVGHTAVDFWGVTDRPKNVDWVYEVDANGFFDTLFERLSRFPATARAAC